MVLRFRLVAAGLLLILAAAAVAGCTRPQRYSYNNIQREYAAPGVTSPAPSPVVPARTMAPSAAVSPIPEIDTHRPIGLTEAIDIALVNNPDRQMAVTRITQAEAMIAKTNAAFYPAVGFYTEYLQGDAPSAYLFKTIDQRQLAPGTDFNNPGWFQNFETAGTFDFNLFNGGQDLLRRRMAETGLNAQQLDRESIDNSLRASVIHAYYNILAAEEFIQISRVSVSTVTEQLRISKVRYSGGGALKSDILSLEVRQAEAREVLVRAENRLKTTTAALAYVMGLDPDTDLQPTGGDPMDVPIPSQFSAGLTHALAHRPEIYRARQHVIQSRMSLDLAKSEYMPTLDFQSRWYVDDENMNYDLDRDNWTAAVMLNWALFTGFSTRAEKRHATAKLEERLTADRKALQSVKFDVKTAYIRLDEARARLNVAKKSVESAEESFQLVRKQYEGGSATITRYLDTELARNRSRLHTANAYFDKEKALADVCRAIGYWSPDNVEAPEEPTP